MKRTSKQLFILTLLLALLNIGCQQRATEHSNPSQQPISLEKQWGVQISGIRLSAAGYMLDFRYKVLDPQKAAPLFAREIRPYLVDQASGAKLIVPNPPKVGPLRQTSAAPQTGKTYFVIFANPGRMVKSGQKVTVVIGDFQVQDIIVQ